MPVWWGRCLWLALLVLGLLTPLLQLQPRTTAASPSASISVVDDVYVCAVSSATRVGRRPSPARSACSRAPRVFLLSGCRRLPHHAERCLVHPAARVHESTCSRRGRPLASSTSAGAAGLLSRVPRHRENHFVTTIIVLLPSYPQIFTWGVACEGTPSLPSSFTLPSTPGAELPSSFILPSRRRRDVPSSFKADFPGN